MFKIVIVFICGMHILPQDCNEDSARSVVVLPQDSGCFESQATLANMAVLWDKETEYLKTLCKS